MKTIKIILFIAIALILLRLALPYAIKHYAEYRINQIPEYKVTIGDVDVELYRGGYTLKNIKLKRINKNIPTPFFTAAALQFAIEWTPLLHGKFAAEIRAEQPSLNFVTDPLGGNEQLTIDQEWRNAVKALFPLNFNTIIVHNGSLHYQSFTSKPPFDIYFKNINAQLNNLRSITRLPNQTLTSSLTVTANSMDGAPFELNLSFDPCASQPTFDLDTKIERMNVKEANSFLQHYTKIEVKRGRFSLYVEAAAANGKIAGYAKPLLEHLQVIEPKTDSAIESLYKGAVQLVADILKNKETDAVATKIDIHGDIDDPDTSIWSVITETLSNAFFEALLPRIDQSIDMKNVNK